MTTAVHEKAAIQYGAFYSSVLGGITTNPAFMCIPMDDHMVSHQALCDCAEVVDCTHRSIRFTLSCLAFRDQQRVQEDHLSVNGIRVL